VLAVDANGTYRWDRQFGGAGPQRAWGATRHGDGVLVSGYFSSSIDFGAGARTATGGEDIFVVLLGPDGSTRWDRTFGGPGAEFGNWVDSDPSRGILMTGYSNDAVDFGGGPHASVGVDDVFVVALDDAGGYRWDRALGSPGSDWGEAAFWHRDGVVAAGGIRGDASFPPWTLVGNGGADCWIVRF
jgi:hypothetical protein